VILVDILKECVIIERQRYERVSGSWFWLEYVINTQQHLTTVGTQR